MAFENKPGFGSIFKNDEKSQYYDPERPYSGTGTVTCPHCEQNTEYWLNVKLKDYMKKDGSEGKFFNIQFKPKQQKVAPRQQEWKDELEDDVPF